MEKSLILLRVIGGAFAVFMMAWSFARFRKHLALRHEFLLISLGCVGLLAVTIVPDSINIVADMLSMKDRQFGRLITLLILSNFIIWILVLGLRSKTAKSSIQFDFLVRRLALEKFLRAEALDSIKEITVILPVLNEQENLDLLLPKIPAQVNGHPLGVIVVDDGSTDNTVSVVKRHGFTVVSNPINRGGGAALRLGYDIAVAGGAKIVLTMDGDGQHRPEEIEGLVKPILDDDADIVIGSRLLGQCEKDSKIRWIGIHIFNFRVESLKKIVLLQDQFHTAELIIDAAKKGLRISEAPVTVLRRFSGVSKKGKNWSYGLNFTKTVLKTWFRK